MSEAYAGAMPGVEAKGTPRSALSRILTALYPAAGPEKRAALVATSILLPATASVLTVIIVLVEPLARLTWVYSLAPVWGTLGAVAAWLVLSRWCTGAADPQCAIPSSYGELLPRLDELRKQLDGFGPAEGSAPPPSVSTARSTALMQHDHIRDDLKVKGLPWVLGTGYVEAWTRMYRAEEALIEFAPPKEVLESALYDEARLEGSEIPNRDDLLAKLRKAILALDPSAYKYLRSTASLTPLPTLAIGTTALPGGTVATDYCTPILAVGGVPPYQWAVIRGPAPDALDLSPAGVLHGTPTNAGRGGFTVQVTDSAGAAAERYFDLLIDPPTQTADVRFSTTTPLPPSTVGVEYIQRLSAAGGTPPYRWELTKGKPPDGIPWSNEGLLKGTPTNEGTFQFEAKVVDSQGAGSQSPKEFTVVIERAKTAAAVSPGGTGPGLNARGVLRTVRHCINEYRNSRWAGLIVARNHLLGTFTLTTMVVFALLAIAITSGVLREQIIAAVVFYLMGAIVGLCNRLRSESQAEAGVQDYGLSAARRITLPLFSGLSAIGGVLLVAYLPFVSPILQSTLTAGSAAAPKTPIAQTAPGAGPEKETAPKPSVSPIGTPETGSTSPAARGPTTPPAGTASEVPPKQTLGAGPEKEAASRPPAPGAPVTGNVPPRQSASDPAPNPPTPPDADKGKPSIANPQNLKTIFNLGENMVGIFVAMVFGLTPGLLFDRLQPQADKYKADLKSSQPAEGTPKS